MTIRIYAFLFLMTLSFSSSAQVASLNTGWNLDHHELSFDQEGTVRRPLILRFGKHHDSFNWEKEHQPYPCSGLSAHVTHECVIMREAFLIAKRAELSFFKHRSGELRRQFVLVAYQRSAGKYHTIQMSMSAHPGRAPNIGIDDKNYRVTLLRGSSLNQMVFQVLYEDEELPVYAAKHISIPVGMGGASMLYLKGYAESVTYLATPDHLNLEELGKRGESYALEHIQEALDTLRVNKVASLAFPGRLVADVIPDRLLLVVIAIEQGDPYRMFGEKHERLLLGDTSKEIYRAVFVRFMLNGLRSYHYICSNKAACGAFQFTNHIGNPGTYDLVRKHYPDAKLDPDFIRGALSFVNAAQAAALLIDLELSNKNLPQSVRDRFLEDPKFAGIFPIAAYNGGASQSIALARLFMQYEKELGTKIHIGNIPWEWKPLVDSRNFGRPMKKETAVYIRKYQLALGWCAW